MLRKKIRKIPGITTERVPLRKSPIQQNMPGSRRKLIKNIPDKPGETPRQNGSIISSFMFLGVSVKYITERSAVERKSKVGVEIGADTAGSTLNSTSSLCGLMSLIRLWAAQLTRLVVARREQLLCPSSESRCRSWNLLKRHSVEGCCPRQRSDCDESLWVDSPNFNFTSNTSPKLAMCFEYFHRNSNSPAQGSASALSGEHLEKKGALTKNYDSLSKRETPIHYSVYTSHFLCQRMNKVFITVLLLYGRQGYGGEKSFFTGDGRCNGWL